MTVVPCLCGLRFGLLITPDLILQGQGSKTTSIMTLDALKPRKGVLILFSLFFLLPFFVDTSVNRVKVIYSLHTLRRFHNMLLLFTVLKGRDSNYTKHLKLWYILSCKQHLDS